ncbi:OsmC family protein [Piscinibacter koreensis]|uniref:OsmC family protein n=1 Tax=Piscinibacter koreensis TaxID=2742824 RepID=A0A7Y6NNT3_9BURK|nr:OsmC family protein [Schlegelella koreensis]NUZ06487.1 OsmC family protein [Schlegelella koreensis]
MASYGAEIEWQRDEQVFDLRRYSRRHVMRFDGGAEVAGSSSPHVVPVPLSDPAAVDPEELFVASLASCHMLFFLSFAAEAGWRVDRYLDRAVGVMGAGADGRQAMTRVTLRPEVTFGGDRMPDAGAIDALHHRAHEACFIANSVKAVVACEPVLASGPAHEPRR